MSSSSMEGKCREKKDTILLGRCYLKGKVEETAHQRSAAAQREPTQTDEKNEE